MKEIDQIVDWIAIAIVVVVALDIFAGYCIYWHGITVLNFIACTLMIAVSRASFSIILSIPKMIAVWKYSSDLRVMVK